ncbi:MAG: hypothetical protein ACYTBZ_26805 [Planctomycetota bacterium]|jgi:hypothetical protein
MGFLDSIFGREKKDAPIALEPGKIRDQQRLTGTALPLAESALGQFGQPFPGDLTTPFERQGLQTLGDYLNSPLPTENPLFQGAAGELQKTFAGEYDPVGSTYYQAYRTGVMRELEEAKDRLAARTSASDKFFGGGRIATEGELEEQATNNLAVVLGQLFEGERDRRLQAVPLAQSLVGAGEAGVQGRIGASQAFGGLEFQREYGDYIRQMEELGIPLETAMQLATHKNEFYQPGYEPSNFERFGMPILQAGAMGLGAGAGAGALGSLGSSLGGGLANVFRGSPLAPWNPVFPTTGVV